MIRQLAFFASFIPMLLFAVIELPEFKLSRVMPDGSYAIETPDGDVRNGSFYVHNGKTGKFEKITPGSVKNIDGGKLLSFKAGTSDVSVKFTARKRMILAELTITNTSDKELFLEPGLTLTVPRSKEDFFYNGYDKIAVTGKPIARGGFKGGSAVKQTATFSTPVSLSIYGNAKRSFSVGSVMYDKHSWLGHGVNKFTDDTASLHYSGRTAIGPKRKTTFRFIIGTVENRYGWEENSIQAMYDSFPEKWTPYVGQENKYIWYAHAMYQVWTYKPNYEYFRRMHMGWDWAYAPYKRSGDIYGHKELWDYKPLAGNFRTGFINMIAGGEFGKFDWRTLSREEFHKNRKQVFDKYGKKFGYAFYPAASGSFCEYGLAKSKYPDSLLSDTDGGIIAIYKNGWTNYYDQDARVFPLGTSFAEQFRKDMHLVYKDLQMPGFSFDCSGCGCYYRGPAVKNYDLPGRAYDSKGVYIDSSVAQTELFEFIHEELAPGKPKHQRPFIVCNGMMNGDVVMIENSPFTRTFHDKMPQWRYSFGALPIVIHGKGYYLPQMIPNWRSLSQKEFLERLARLMDFAVFTEFRYGMTSSSQLYLGNATAQYAMPELLECIRLGWQVVNPVNCDNGEKILYNTRYGRGADTILFCGNPYETAMPVKIAVGNDILGDKVYLFVRKMRDSGTLTQKVYGKETHFDYEIPSRIPVLFEAACGFSELPDGEVEATSQKGLDKQQFTIKLKNRSSFTAAVTPRQIRSFSAPEITLNGQKITAENKVEFAPDSVLTLTYHSKDFKIPSIRITSFPFLNAHAAPDFAVVVPADADKETLALAENFQEYFRFCAGKKLCNPGKVDILRQIPANKPCILLNFNEKDPAKCGVSRKGRILTVTAENSFKGDALVRSLCHAMDKRFEFYHGMGGIDGFPGEILDKFNLRGKCIPVKRCFEKGGDK